MSYDGFYGELSTRGTINDLLSQANSIKVSIGASEAAVAADTSEVGWKHAEVTQKAAQVQTNANLVSTKAQEVQDNSNYVAGIAAKYPPNVIKTDDPRLTNAREWTAATILQAEAEDGTAITRRAFTAQRVRQAIVAWFNGISGALGRTILTRTTVEQVRADIGLGTAATYNVGTVSGQLLAVGSNGYGTVDSMIIGDWDQATKNGVYYQATGGLNAPISGWLLGRCQSHNAAHCTQTVETFNQGYYPRAFKRHMSSGTWNPWVEILHTGNILGTVSQSGGAPTGAIIERGSNANGEYVKYADGTMICWHTDTTLLTTSQVVGTLYFSPTDRAMTFPVEFVSIPTVTHSVVDMGGFCLGAVANNILTVGIVNTRILGSFNTSAGFFSYAALGRWY